MVETVNQSNRSSRFSFKLSVLLVYVALVLMEFCSWTLVVVQPSLFYYLKIFTVILFILSALTRKWKVNEGITAFIIVSVCIVTYFLTNQDILLYFAIALIAFKSVSFKNVAKIDLFSKLIFVSFIVILYFAGAIAKYDILMSSGRIRYSFGYYNPNNFFFCIYIMVVDILVLYKEKLKVFHLILLGLFAGFIGYLTYCRTGIFLLWATLIVFWMSKRIVLSRHKIIKFVLIYSFVICLGLSVLALVIYRMGIPFATQLDTLFSGRIRFASEFLTEYNLSVFGQKIVTVTGLESSLSGLRALNLDNFYFYSLISYGIVFTVMVAILFIKAQKKMLRQGEFFFAIIFCLLAIYSLSEKVLISFETNVWVFLFGYAFYDTTSNGIEQSG